MKRKSGDLLECALSPPAVSGGLVCMLSAAEAVLKRLGFYRHSGCCFQYLTAA
ncbi:MAG: hypothetical protein IKH21_03665 [Clostridia bacterium]|nr:hypothetical protein [Clostridia bacterium]